MPAQLSVVVAVHDVSPWIEECLDSVASCVPDGAEVVVVDDGSVDGSGRLCDRAAQGRPSWTVVHQANAGLGAARNVGIAASSGEYVGFVDGDDVLLPPYAGLLAEARRQDAAIATGAVLRTDGVRSWPSGLHARALAPLTGSADIRHDRSLIFDTTAWNKVYRRSFLLEHGLRFPEGVLYEDLPLTIPALCLAGRVAVLHRPVYAWRSRREGLSITQRRFELQNLQDRFAAVRAVDRFLEEHGLEELRTAHDDKVIRLDLPLYTAALPEAGEGYVTAYLGFFHHLVDRLPQSARERLPPTVRLYVELAARGRVDDLVTAVRGRRGPVAWAPDRRSAAERVRADWAAFALERSLGLVTLPQLARRAPVRTVTLALPPRLRPLLGAVRARARLGAQERCRILPSASRPPSAPAGRVDRTDAALTRTDPKDE